MKSYHDILEGATSYWQETDRKSYIALYKGKRLNTKQIAYLTIGATKKALADLLLEYSTFVETPYGCNRTAINSWIKQALADGVIEIVALEDMEPNFLYHR